MWTNFIDRAAGGFCRGLNGAFGHFPGACLTDGGRPALLLATIIAFAIIGVVVIGRKRLHR